ncbi:MAG: hypothetical protein AB7G93_10145 [Bdellovibrionales bacterium]
MKMLFALLVAGLCQVTMAGGHHPNPSTALDKLKSLAGEWEFESEGRTFIATFEVVSQGQAVVERTMGMVDVFHVVNGNQLMDTHYCSLGNQPRMIYTMDPLGNKLEFRFHDITNLSPGQEHISQHMIEFVSDREIIETWISRDASGAESGFSLKLTRRSKGVRQ